jgi:hypothetical protein
MSLLTPDEENAAGIVSRFTQPPFANEKKSWQALTDVSMYEGSKTFSGAIGTADPGVELRCAPAVLTKTIASKATGKRSLGMSDECRWDRSF